MSLNISELGFVVNPTLCEELYRAGLTEESKIKWRKDKSRGNYALLSTAFDPDEVYGSIDFALPDNVSSNYEFMPAYFVSDLIEIIPECLINNYNSFYEVSTISNITDMSYKSNVLGNAVGEMVLFLVKRQIINLHKTNEFLKFSKHL